MNLSRKMLVGVALTGLLLGGCTSKVTETTQYSGFLSDYNNLQEVSTPSGGTAMRWVSPSWNANAYDTVAFNKLQLYPAPQPNERVNQQTLDDLQNYMTTKAKGVLGQKYPDCIQPVRSTGRLENPDPALGHHRCERVQRRHEVV